MNEKEQGTKLTNGRASPCRPPWRAAAPPPCTASTASTATEITTAITVALQYQTMCRNTVYFTCVACNGHHGLRSLRAVAVGGGADGVALAQNLIVLFFSTYLIMSVTRRVDHRKARLISSRNEKAHRVARHRRCCSCSCLFPIVRFACCSTYEGLTTVLARLN